MNGSTHTGLDSTAEDKLAAFQHSVDGLQSNLAETKQCIATVAHLEKEFHAMRLTWSSAHTAMTEDMRELMKKFNEATPLQLASQLQDIRQSLNPPPSSNIQVEGKNEQESQGRPRLPSGFDGNPNASIDTRLRDPS